MQFLLLNNYTRNMEISTHILINNSKLKENFMVKIKRDFLSNINDYLSSKKVLKVFNNNNIGIQGACVLV